MNAKARGRSRFNSHGGLPAGSQVLAQRVLQRAQIVTLLGKGHPQIAEVGFVYLRIWAGQG